MFSSMLVNHDTKSLSKEEKKPKGKKQNREHLMNQVKVENSEEDVEGAAIECIISTIGNVTEWVSCESCGNWYHSETPLYLTRHLKNSMKDFYLQELLI